MYVVVWYPFFHCWPTFRPCSLTYPKPPYTRSRIEDGRHWWLMSIFYNFKIISYRYRPTYFVRKGGLILWVYNISLTWYKYINVHIYHLPEYKTVDVLMHWANRALPPDPTQYLYKTLILISKCCCPMCRSSYPNPFLIITICNCNRTKKTCGAKVTHISISSAEIGSLKQYFPHNDLLNCHVLLLLHTLHFHYYSFYGDSVCS